MLLVHVGFDTRQVVQGSFTALSRFSLHIHFKLLLCTLCSVGSCSFHGIFEGVGASDDEHEFKLSSRLQYFVLESSQSELALSAFFLRFYFQFGGESAHLSPLNGYIAEAHQRFK